MVEYNWDIAPLERYEKLSLLKGDSVKVVFEDDGNMVSKDLLRDAGAKFPRDSIVFVVTKSKEKLEWWVSATAFSTLKQLKVLRDVSGTLKGVKAVIERISDNPVETNYKIVGA